MHHGLLAAERSTQYDYGIAGQLDQIQRAIEGKFCDAGDVLLRSLDAINDMIASLDTLAATFDAQTAAATTADLTLAAAKLCTLPASHAKHRDGITRLSRSHAKLTQHISMMRCSLSFMSAFIRNAAVVADASADAGIASLAAGVARCVSESESELRSLEDELVLLQRELGRSITQADLLEKHIAVQLPTVPEELAGAARFVSSHYKAVASTVEQVAIIARAISTRVSRLLGALQFGDITRQRIEHIQMLIAEAEAETAWRPAGLQARFRATCYALIAMHLMEIGSDFDREIVEIEHNMTQLGADAEALLKLHDIAFDNDGGRKDSFLRALGYRIADTAKLVDAIVAADLAAMNTGRITGDTAHSLGRHIDRIQSLRNDMRTMAASEELGKSASSNITAVEIRDHCSVLEEAANVGLITLDKLLHLTRSIADRDSERPQDSKAASAATALGVAGQRISDVREKAENGLASIAAQGDAVVAMLNLSGSRLRLRREIGDVLSSVTKLAEALSQGAYRAGEEIPEALLTMLSAFSRRYTMAQERNVHRVFLECLLVSVTVPIPAFDDGDEFLF